MTEQNSYFVTHLPSLILKLGSKISSRKYSFYFCQVSHWLSWGLSPFLGKADREHTAALFIRQADRNTNWKLSNKKIFALQKTKVASNKFLKPATFVSAVMLKQKKGEKKPPLQLLKRKIWAHIMGVRFWTCAFWEDLPEIWHTLNVCVFMHNLYTDVHSLCVCV